MIDELIEWVKVLGNIEFWVSALEIFRGFGPAAPILLTCVESFIPVLPLVAIVTLNITACGPLFGLIYSWIGTSIGCTCVFLIFRKLVKPNLKFWIERKEIFVKALKWISKTQRKVLFTVAMMPFTPSVFVNMAFGLSDMDESEFLKVLISAKSVMMILISLFGNSVVASASEPLFIILSAVIFAVLWVLSKKVGQSTGL